MMKKKTRVLKEPSSSTSYFPGGEEARTRFKYHSLLQDYQELLKETEDKKDKLEKILQKKFQLLAEVKFLRRKYQQFSATQTLQFKLKKQSPRFPSSKNQVFQAELPLKIRNQKAKEILIPTSTTLLDLNQVFLPTSEEMKGIEVVEQTPLNVGRFKRFSREGGDVLASDDTLSFCRDSRMGSNKAGKRKVSWQDRLALRV